MPYKSVRIFKTSIKQAITDRNTGMLELLISTSGTYSQRELEQSFLLASRNGYTDCIQILIRAKINVDACDSSSKTAVMLSAESGHVETLRVLIWEAKCDVNKRNSSGGTALHGAAQNGHEDCVSELIKAGVNLNAVDLDGNTALLLAAKNCRQTLKAIKQLADAKCNLDVKDRDLKTALHYASYKAMGTELLLSAGASPDFQDSDGNTPLHLASIEGFDTIVRCLVTYNCNVNLINSFGKMAIHYLAMKDHWRAIEDIVKAGGDIDHPDLNGLIPLWYAVNHNRSESVLTLLRANCSPDPPDTSHSVPLEIALQKKLYGISQQLLLAGSRTAPVRKAVENYLARQKLIAEERQQRSTMFVVDEEEEIEVDENEKLAMEWLMDWISQPHCLRHICRIQIRKCARSNVNYAKLFQWLPSSIQEFITLKELEFLKVNGELM